MSRLPLDQYETPSWQVDALLRHQPFGVADSHDGMPFVLEPCWGDGAITRRLPVVEIMTNDIDVASGALYHEDAADPDGLWPMLADPEDAPDWIITNPPFQMPTCRDIVINSVKCAKTGVAMLLPLSFLEPTAHKNPRGPWLERNPPDRLIVLPRHSYRGNGKTASMTTAWHIWFTGTAGEPSYEALKAFRPIVCAYNADTGG